MQFDAVLSVATGVGRRGWPISTKAVRMDVDFWQFSNNPTNSTYMADVMRFIMIMHSTCTRPFSGDLAFIGVLLLDLGLRKKIYSSAA